MWSKGLEKIANLQAKRVFTIGCNIPETAGKLVEKGVKNETIFTIGFPLRREFYEDKPSRDVLCRELNLPVDKKIIMLLNGGGGGKSILKSTETLAAEPLHAHFVVITGKNEALKQSVSKITLHPSNSLTALSYTDRISDFMRVSRLLITKAGPGTINEASAIYRKYQTPFVLVENANCLFWEKPNIRIVEEGGFGESFEKWDLLEAVTHHLIYENPPPKLDKMPLMDFSIRFSEIVNEMTQDPKSSK